MTGGGALGWATISPSHPTIPGRSSQDLIQIEVNQSVYRTTEGLLVVEDHSQ